MVLDGDYDSTEYQRRQGVEMPVGYVLLIVVWAFLMGAWSGELILGNLSTDASQLTAWFTGGQVAVAIAQALLFVWQFHFMRRSVDAANDAAKAATTSAQTAKDSFTKLERPYLFVYGVTTIMQDPKRVGGLESFVRFNVANHGKTPAIIESVEIGFSVDPAAPHAPLHVEQEHQLLTHPILGAGEVRDGLEETLPLGVEVIQTGNDRLLIPDLRSELGSEEELFFVIYVRYKGAFTEGHETQCCWRYDRTSGHFTQLRLGGLNFLK